MNGVPKTIQAAVQSLKRAEARARKRRPRFERKPTKPFRFNESRHGPVLEMLYFYGAARTSDIVDITTTAYDRIREEEPGFNITNIRKFLTDDELSHMYHDGGLLTRRKVGNTEQILHGLSTTGAKKLRDTFGYAIANTDYTQDFKTRTPASQKHKSEIARYSAAIHRAARVLDGIEFTDRPEIFKQNLIPADVWMRRKEAKLKDEYWKASLSKGTVKKLQAEADWMHRFLGCSFDPETPQFHFPEIDMGTESVNSKNLKRTSIYRKMLCYINAYYQGFHKEYWGIQSFRIPWIINTGYHGKERLDNFLEVTQTVTNGKGTRLFVFIPAEALSSENILLETFVNGKGETVRLVD